MQPPTNTYPLPTATYRPGSSHAACCTVSTAANANTVATSSGATVRSRDDIVMRLPADDVTRRGEVMAARPSERAGGRAGSARMRR